MMNCLVALCEKTKVFENQKGHHLKMARKICSNYWQRPIYDQHVGDHESRSPLNDTFSRGILLGNVSSLQDKYLHKVGQLVSVKKKINFMRKKRENYMI